MALITLIRGKGLPGADAAEYFRLPRDRTVIMGSRIEL